MPRWREGSEEGGLGERRELRRERGRAEERGRGREAAGRLGLVWRLQRPGERRLGCGRWDRVRAGPGPALPVSGAKMNMPYVVIPHSLGNNKAQERLLCRPRAMKCPFLSPEPEVQEQESILPSYILLSPHGSR